MRGGRLYLVHLKKSMEWQTCRRTFDINVLCVKSGGAMHSSPCMISFAVPTSKATHPPNVLCMQGCNAMSRQRNAIESQPGLHLRL